MKSARSAKAKSKTSAKPSKSAKKSAPAKKDRPSLKKAISAKAQAPKAKAAVEVAPKKSELLKKILSTPYDLFMAAWKPKNETFEMGLDKLLAQAGVPEKERPKYFHEVTEKIYVQMRKHPLGAAIEEQLAERYTKDRIHKLATIFSMRPKTTVRLNYLKADLIGFGQSQVAQDLKIKRSTLSPWAYEVGKPEELMAHPIRERGLFEIQDEASQILSLFTNARPGNRILDLCAKDGHNALAVATMMRNKGSLFIYEADAKRLKVFKERAQRAGIDSYRVVSDSQISEVKSLDVVLVDAPSSHLGELATRPEVRWKFQKEELSRLHKLQAALLREGARKLKLGGYLIYATTSLNKSENEAQIENFLRTSHNSYRLVSAVGYLKDYILPYVNNFFRFNWDEKSLQAMSEAEPYFVLSPDTLGCSGLFVAVVQRTRIST